ncbi:DUF5367 family protein [Changchengzhania lutea]|uniref:DUF5367 family protein n=1 Tax=Changchengzhania lutea TaxID=2049305 RepID=UPI00115D5158|nr:DUF5367 family protein [Changchengzhania lutea]
MKTKRAVLTGVVIWIIAVLFYSLSYYVTILEDATTQANTVLFITVMPLVWLGCHYYYKKDYQTHGVKVGQTMLLTSVALDALITVPLFEIPNGGSHYSFFTAPAFWIIAFEFLLVAALYYYAKVYSKLNAVKK